MIFLAVFLIASLSLNGLLLFVVYKDAVTMAELRRIATTQTNKKHDALELLANHARGD
jgi:hypothetical protein